MDLSSSPPAGDRRAELSISFWSNIGTKYRVEVLLLLLLLFWNFNS